MPTLNYTTKVPVARTISEIQTMLVKQGADGVAVRYSDQEAAGLSFTLLTAHGSRMFSLPVDTAAVHRVLIAQSNAGEFNNKNWTTPEHARRVAWRVLKDWLAAQLAIIEAQMASLDQVMLPYMHAGGELTVYDAYVEREESLRALTSGEPA